MSNTSAPGPVLTKLSKHPLIEAAFAIAEATYTLLPDMPESEKWDTTARLRQASNHLLLKVARAVANSAPTGSEFDWADARKEAAALLTMLRFAIKQGFMDRNSELLLEVSGLIEHIDVETKAAYERGDAHNRYELSLWEEKYAMWRKLNSELQR
jgi:hypothetical protein